jgi:hypothetical protein
MAYSDRLKHADDTFGVITKNLSGLASAAAQWQALQHNDKILKAELELMRQPVPASGSGGGSMTVSPPLLIGGVVVAALAVWGAVK